MALSTLLVKGKKTQTIKVINSDGVVIFTCKSSPVKQLALENLNSCQIESQGSANWDLSVSKMGTQRLVLNRAGKRIGATKGAKDLVTVTAYKDEFIQDISTQTPINY